MWSSGERYQRFMGRWGEALAERVILGLDEPAGGEWLDVGCGAGGVTARVLEHRAPRCVSAIDTSTEFVRATKERFRGQPVEPLQADARHLPFPADAFDATVSGLTLNFVPEPDVALGEMARVTKPGGTVSAWVWDYDDPRMFLTRFWRAAEVVLGERLPEDERDRWPVCTVAGLEDLLRSSDLDGTVEVIEFATSFRSHGEVWDGFLLGIGPAGHAVAAMDEHTRQAVRSELFRALPARVNGRVHIPARALLLRGTP